MAEVDDAGVPGIPVADARALFIGVVSRAKLAEEAECDEGGSIGRLADPTAQGALVTDHLNAALEAMLLGRASWVPVLDRDRHVVGIITIGEIVGGYRRGLRTHLRQVSQISPSTEVLDVRVEEGSPAQEVTIRELRLPTGTIVMTLLRGDDLIPCHGTTVLRVDDQVGILTHVEELDRVRARFATPACDEDDRRRPRS